MREITRVHFSFNLIFQNLKRSVQFILIATACLLVFAYSILLHYAGNYNYMTSDEIFVCGVENTGLIYAEGNGGYELIGYMDEFYDDVREIDGVYALAQSSNTCDISLSRFGDYSKNEALVAASSGGSIHGVSISTDTAKICNMNLLSGTMPDELAYDDYTIYLYLGYDFRDIPLGTIYEEERPDGTYYRVIVAGILEKGQRWLDANYYISFDFTSISDYICLDSSYLYTNGDDFGFPLFFNFEEGYDFDDISKQIKEVGEKYGVTLSVNSIGQKYAVADEQRSVMNRAVRDCILLMAVTSISLLLCMEVLEFYQNKRQYGLYLVTGMTAADIGHIISWKKLIETVLALVLSLLLTYRICLYMFDINEDVNNVIMDVLGRYVIWQLLIISLVLFLFSTIFSVEAVKRYTPIELLEKEE